MNPKIPLLSFKGNSWDIILPTISAFRFEQEEIYKFITGDIAIPKIFDTNLVSGCNTNCKYCSTMSGNYDVRYPFDEKIPFISDTQIKELIRQFGKLSIRTFFICSNGEPLLNPQRVLDITKEAKDYGIRLITYTNGTTLDSKILKELYKRGISLVMKLESLSPSLNDEIILNKGNKRKKGFKGYKYGMFNGQKVPSHIIDAYNIYGTDSDKLGLETMITKDNIHEVLEIRSWAYSELKTSQFLKHLYPLGYASLRGENVIPDPKRVEKLIKKIYSLDADYGMKYPSFDTPDHYSYDARRLINNLTNKKSFPFRIFGHERGGIYHSSSVSAIKFGFGTQRIIKLIDEKGKVNAKDYFEKINQLIIENVT